MGRERACRGSGLGVRVDIMAAAVKGSRAGNALFSGRSTERRGSLEVRVDGKLASEVGGGGLLVIGNVEFLVPVDDFDGADRNGTLAVSSLSSPGGAFDVVGFVGADPGGVRGSIVRIHLGPFFWCGVAANPRGHAEGAKLLFQGEEVRKRVGIGTVIITVPKHAETCFWRGGRKGVLGAGGCP